MGKLQKLWEWVSSFFLQTFKKYIWLITAMIVLKKNVLTDRQTDRPVPTTPYVNEAQGFNLIIIVFISFHSFCLCRPPPRHPHAAWRSPLHRRGVGVRLWTEWLARIWLKFNLLMASFCVTLNSLKDRHQFIIGITCDHKLVHVFISIYLPRFQHWFIQHIRDIYCNCSPWPLDGSIATYEHRLLLPSLFSRSLFLE